MKLFLEMPIVLCRKLKSISSRDESDRKSSSLSHFGLIITPKPPLRVCILFGNSCRISNLHSSLFEVIWLVIKIFSSRYYSESLMGELIMPIGFSSPAKNFRRRIAKEDEQIMEIEKFLSTSTSTAIARNHLRIIIWLIWAEHCDVIEHFASSQTIPDASVPFQ